MKNNESTSLLKKVMPVVTHPTTIGIILTFVLTAGAYFFYLGSVSSLKATKSIQFLLDLDQKTVDLRFKARGPREASNDVAVLAVDDRSIDIIGRWPWPRDVLAIAIDRAFSYGAKVISSDIVWSEKTHRPELKLIENLNSKGFLNESSYKTINEEISKTDPDRAFGDMIEKNKDKFIVGNFYEKAEAWQNTDASDGYISRCHDLILNRNDLGKLLERQQTPIVSVDSNDFELPSLFKEAYERKFAEIKEEFLMSRKDLASGFKRYEFEKELQEKYVAFCDKEFLRFNTKTKNSQNDPDDIAFFFRDNWPQILESSPDLKFPTFEEWFNFFSKQNPMNKVLEVTKWTLTFPELIERGENFGYFNALLDNDGSIRYSQTIVRSGGSYIPSISLLPYLIATKQHIELKMQTTHDGFKGIDQMIVTNEDGEPQFNIPVDQEGRLIINYAGPGKTIAHASIADLLDDSNPNITIKQSTRKPDGHWTSSDNSTLVPKEKFFKDKILILGATSVGIFDLRVTPFDENFPGVETHANVVDNLLRRDFLMRSPLEPQYMPLFMLLIGFVLSIALSRFGALSGMIFTLISLAVIAFVDREFFFLRGKLISIMLPIFQVFFTYVSLTFYKYFTEERSKKELRATFSKYVSPAIVEEILQDPKNLELGGRKERVTVFFSDVRGFTTISEKLDPKALSDFLNSYLTPMTELVFKNQGTLDKYMGDAIMAFFGAPVHYPDHAKMACRCALQHLEKLKELQEIYKKANLPGIDIGIGLNTGECSVGNMGSETVRSYTVMGDSVNLASRLEGINKTYGTHIIISEFTHAEVKNDFTCREVDWVRVKGKLEPVKIFELITEGKPDAKVIDMVNYFNDGYANYHRRHFDKAIQNFQKAVGQHPADETAKIYIERCQDYIADPPPENWDGVYVMKTK